MELAVLGSILALFVSLGALWLVGSIQNKLDFQNDTFSQVHIKPLRAELKAVKAHLEKLEQKMRDLSGLYDSIQTITEGQDGIKEATKNELVAIRQKIEALDSSIPTRYRIAVKPKQKSPKPKRNPPIQE